MTLSTSSQTLCVCVLFMKPGRTAALIDVVSPKFKIIPFERVGFIQQANNFVINFFLLKRLLTFPHTAVCLRLWKRARCCWMTLRLSVSDMYSSRAFSQRNLIQAFIFIQMDSGLFFWFVYIKLYKKQYVSILFSGEWWERRQRRKSDKNLMGGKNI